MLKHLYSTLQVQIRRPSQASLRFPNPRHEWQSPHEGMSKLLSDWPINQQLNKKRLRLVLKRF